LLTILIEGERAPSWNGIYSGMHFAERSRMAKAIHWKVRAALPQDCELFDCVVDILLTATYRRNVPYADNIFCKGYIDGLKGHIIHDDNGRWVRRVTTEAVRGKEDSVLIVVMPVE
jgi:hypothetical protein